MHFIWCTSENSIEILYNSLIEMSFQFDVNGDVNVIMREVMQVVQDLRLSAMVQPCLDFLLMERLYHPGLEY